MNAPTPSFLLNNPEMVLPEAPWCCWLDNLEVAILMLAQPWLAGGGLRRAELEQQLKLLGRELPLGQIYFQRVSRSAALLVERGQLACSGSARDRRFAITARGFAALLLNLQVLRSDPTVDGAEFELKRSLVALWNQVMAQVLAVDATADPGRELGHLFVDLEELEVLGHRVVTDVVVRQSFDLPRLIQTQRGMAQDHLRMAELQLRRAEFQRGMLERASAGSAGSERRSTRKVSPQDAAQQARAVATASAPWLQARAAILRYRAFVAYLDELEALYREELDTPALSGVPHAVSGE